MLLNYITWNASPEIISLGPITLRWYGLLFASGFLVGLFMVRKMFLAEKAPEEWLDSAFVYIVVGAVLGARFGHVFFYDWAYYREHLSEIPKIWHGGLASHGGAIGVILGLWLFSMRVSKKSILWILDKVVVPTALAASFIRLGNLMNSEILGKNADVPWAFLFVRPNADGPDALPRHPVQLYESFAYLILFVVLYLIYWNTKFRNKPGFVFGMFMTLLWSIRIVMETFKESQGGFESAFNNVLSTGQLLSIPFILIGLYFVFRPVPSFKSGS